MNHRLVKTLKEISRSYWMIVICTVISTLILWPAEKKLIAEGRDIRQDYLGIHRLLARETLYDRFSTEELRNINVDPNLGMPQNFHPPTTLLVFLPFALLDFDQAVFLWSVASLIFFYLALFLISKELKFPGLMIFGLVAAVWFPLWLNIRFGQFSTLIFLFITFAWRSLRANQQKLAGIALSAAALVKLFPAFLLVESLINWRWRVLVWFSLLFLLIAAPLYFYYPDGTVEFITEVTQNNSQLFRGYYGNSGISGFLGRLTIGSREIEPLAKLQEVHSVLYLLLSSVILIVLVIYLRLLRDQFDLGFSFTIVCMLLLLPTTWVHNFVVLVLPGTLLYLHFKTSNDRNGLFSLIALIVLSSIPHWQMLDWFKGAFGNLPMPSWVGLTSPGFYVLIGMFILLIRVGWKVSGKLYLRQ